MEVSAFSDNGKYFSLISIDGKLKVWDAETNVLKQDYTPDSHLSSPPTCLKWISLGGGSTRRKRKSSQVDGVNLNVIKNSYIALGTTTGKILLYSVEQARIENILSDERSVEASDTNITCIDWSIESGLFSCSSDSVLREWNISENGTKKNYKLKVDNKNAYSNKITAIKLLPSSQLAGNADRFILLGCCRIKLYDLNTCAIVKDFTGHSADITHLSIANFSSSGKCFAVSACKNERIISLWNLSLLQDDTSQSKQQKKKLHPSISSCNFLTEDVPINVSCYTEDGDETNLVLAAVTRTGSLHYYSHILNGVSTVKAIKPNVTVQVATEEAQPLPTLCCHLSSEIRESVIIAYLSSQASQNITFEKIVPDLSSKSQVLVRQSLDPTKKAKAKRDADEASKVRSEASNSSAVQEQTTYLDGGGGMKPSIKRNAGGKRIEVPMESRLANLSLEKGGLAKSSTKQNIGQLLLQGLHSNDKNLLLTALQCTDPQVAFNSVSRLPPRYLNPLLSNITEMLSRQTSQAKAACVWLSAAIRAHSSPLLATASSEPIAETLAGLLSALDVKRSNLSALLSLKGRLALTLGQLEDQPEEANEEENAMLEYRDSSDSESIDQDALGPVNRMTSDDDNSWDEDDDPPNASNDADEQTSSEIEE